MQHNPSLEPCQENSEKNSEKNYGPFLATALLLLKNSEDPEDQKLYRKLLRLNTAIQERKENNIAYQDSCPLSIPNSLKYPGIAKSKSSKPRKDPKNTFFKLTEEAKAYNISDSTLKKALFNHLERQGGVLYLNDEGVLAHAPMKIRGSKEYQNEAKARMLQYSKNLQNSAERFMFLTITCSPKQYNYNLLDAIDGTIAKATQLWRALRKKYGVKHVHVLEFMKRGIPHIHAILSIPDDLYPELANAKKQAKIDYGPIIQNCSKFFPGTRVELQTAEPKQVSGYLAKYITKAPQGFDPQKIDLDKPLSSDARKWALGIMLPIIAQKRTMGASRSLSIGGGQVPVKNIADEDWEPFKEEIMRGSTKIEENTPLLRLLNKTTEQFCHSAVLLTKIGRNTLLEEFGGYIEKPSSELSAFLAFNGLFTKCQGCPIREKIAKLCNKKHITIQSRVPLEYLVKYCNSADKHKAISIDDWGVLKLKTANVKQFIHILDEFGLQSTLEMYRSGKIQDWDRASPGSKLKLRMIKKKEKVLVKKKAIPPPAKREESSTSELDIF